MRGGFVLLRRTQLGYQTERGRRGYGGLSLGACRLSGPPRRAAATTGRLAVQGQAATIAEGPDRAHGFLGVQGQVVSIPARLATGYGQVAVRSTEAYAAVRTSAVLGSVAGQGQANTSASSSLGRTTSGLILYHDYSLVADHALTTSADALGYLVATTIDHGTWAFSGGVLTCTAGANPEDCRNMSLSQGPPAVFETRFHTPSVNSTQGGPEFAIQSGADTRMLYLVRNGDATLYNRTAGAWGSGHGGTNPSGMVQDAWISAKVRWTGTNTFSCWVNRVLRDSAFTHTGVVGAGGFGLVAVSAANSVFKDYAIYTSTVLTVDNLTGTQAFRLMDSGGSQIAASSAQSGGSATIDLATVCDCPFTGSIEVHASTSFSSLVTGGRYPAAGNATDIYGGDLYTMP